MIKNILIPLDGSDHSKAALDYGLWMTDLEEVAEVIGHQLQLKFEPKEPE